MMFDGGYADWRGGWGSFAAKTNADPIACDTMPGGKAKKVYTVTKNGCGSLQTHQLRPKEAGLPSDDQLLPSSSVRSKGLGGV
jgi:hypothetical protein